MATIEKPATPSRRIWLEVLVDLDAHIILEFDDLTGAERMVAGRQNFEPLGTGEGSTCLTSQDRADLNAGQHQAVRSRCATSGPADDSVLATSVSIAGSKRPSPSSR